MVTVGRASLMLTLKADVERLEKQVISMQCCGNCKHYGVSCFTGQSYDINGKYKLESDGSCDDWKDVTL